jgi:hypothetical protein
MSSPHGARLEHELVMNFIRDARAYLERERRDLTILDGRLAWYLTDDNLNAVYGDDWPEPLPLLRLSDPLTDLNFLANLTAVLSEEGHFRVPFRDDIQAAMDACHPRSPNEKCSSAPSSSWGAPHNCYTIASPFRSLTRAGDAS